MTIPTLSTRLEAVNTILSAAGEAPVSSLAGTTADAANADNILQETLVAVQSEGWHFNTEKDVPLVPASDKTITLPANTLKVDIDRYRYPNEVAQRGLRLYDRTARSYTFTSPLSVEIVYALPWEELPEHARRYITLRAARIFHDRFIGSESAHTFTERDETQARLSLTSADLDASNTNLFTGNPQFAALLSRRR
jgi:hypothetical protein